jgi:hypothetical protein
VLEQQVVLSTPLINVNVMKAPRLDGITVQITTLVGRCGCPAGAKGSGAPIGNKSALKHGMYTRDSLKLRSHVRQLLRDGKELIEKV